VRLLRETEAGILLNEHIAEDGATVFAHACRLGAEGIVSKRIDSAYHSGPCRAPCSASAVRFGIGDYRPWLFRVHSVSFCIHGHSRPTQCLIGLADLPDAVVTYGRAMRMRGEPKCEFLTNSAQVLLV
jgi:hypothetical protein